MTPNFPLALTYDDVLLVPQHSRVKHRTDADTTTNLTSKIKMAIPFLSANMDTVTESRMAIALAKAGGLGVLHRFMSIEDQVTEVDQVKRYESFIIKNPYTVSPDKPVKHIIEKITNNHITSYLVIDPQRHLLGIITRRDVIFTPNFDLPISKIMTPIKKLITVKPNITQSQAKKLFARYKIEKLPVLDPQGQLLGLVTARSITNSQQEPYATKDGDGRLRCGAAVGVVGDFLERADALIKAGIDILVVDVAHGQNIASLTALKKIRQKYPDIDLIGGNVATQDGVKDMIRVGVNAIKVGIGPGGICSTRTVTGVGVPQLSAILDCCQAARGSQVKIIADGGTNYPGDITKALAAGASTIMLAGWFAGTDESPGEIINRKNRRYKIHRGSASFMSQVDRSSRLHQDTHLNTIVPEGVESLIEYKGPVAEIIYQLLGALRSGMSYCNASNIPELQKRAKFIRMTPAGFRESLTHNVDEI